MSQKYENVLFWNDLLSLPFEMRVEVLKKEKENLTELMKEDKFAFLGWKAFFSSVMKADTEVFKWLLTLRPEVNRLHCPFDILHEDKSFNGCTLLQLMLLFKPCHEYLDLIEDTVKVLDCDGNSSLLYAACSDDAKVYERVWKLLNGDGRVFRRPGPNSAAVLVQAGWSHIKRKQISVVRLIEALGGLKATMNFAIKENSLPFANELLKQLKDVDWDEFVELLMNGSFVDFKTFLELVDDAMSQKKDLKAFPQEIIRRAYALCKKDSHYRQLVRLVASIKENFGWNESLDELVEFTGSPYRLLYYVYNFPTCLNTLNKIASRYPPPPEVFDLCSKVFGSYLHVVCKLIGSFEPYVKGNSLYCASLEGWYMPGLLQVTKDKHWTVVDSEGKKPLDYMGESIYCFSTIFQNELRRRNYSDKIRVTSEISSNSSD